MRDRRRRRRRRRRVGSFPAIWYASWRAYITAPVVLCGQTILMLYTAVAVRAWYLCLVNTTVRDLALMRRESVPTTPPKTADSKSRYQCSYPLDDERTDIKYIIKRVIYVVCIIITFMRRHSETYHRLLRGRRVHYTNVRKRSCANYRIFFPPPADVRAHCTTSSDVFFNGYRPA